MCAKRLLVIAGPQCSGKSTLIQSLGVGEESFLSVGQRPKRFALREWAHAVNMDLLRGLPETSRFSGSQALEFGDPSSWKALSASDLASVQMQKRDPGFSLSTYIARRLQELHIDRLVLHYGIVSPWRHLGESGGYEADERLDTLDLFDQTTFVTVWANPELLRNRLKRRIAKVLESVALGQVPPLCGLRRAYRLGLLRRLSKSVPGLLHRYDLWFQFCDTHEPKAHWIVDNSGVPKWFPRSSWSELRGRVMDSLASGT